MCMWEYLFNNHNFTCNNCPIKKYQCCGTSERDLIELQSRLNLDITKLMAIKQKVVDNVNNL